MKALIVPSALIGAALIFIFSRAANDPVGAEHHGPVPPINTGYGSWGTHATVTATFQVRSAGYTNTVTLYFPSDQTSASPTIFFAPGWNIPCEDYGQLSRFLVSKGYVVICDDYGEDSGVIGEQLNECFSEAVSRYSTRVAVDTIGLMGHSSGAGLLPSLTYDFVRNKGWGGQNGEHTFIFSSAPWFDFDLTDDMLADYPPGVKLLMQTYEDDFSTDLRTYIDIFESLPIVDDEKDYITLRTSTIATYTYRAAHSTIATGDATGYGTFDALDDYGVFRLVDALAAYTFSGDMGAKEVALGDGAEAQSDMGALRDLISTDDPRPIPGVSYEYNCDVDINPRREHCDDYDGELPAAVLITPTKHITLTITSPVFQWEPVPTANRYYLQIRPLLPNDEPDWDVSFGEEVTSEQAGCDNLQNCSFRCTDRLPDGRYVWWIRAYNETQNGVWSRRGYFQRVSAIYLPVVVRNSCRG